VLGNSGSIDIMLVSEITSSTTATIQKKKDVDLVTGQHMRPSKKPKVQLQDNKKLEIQDEEEDNFVEQDISKCPICQEQPKNPLTAKCGHVCCKECWDKLLSTTLQCPLCRARIRAKHLTATTVQQS